MRTVFAAIAALGVSAIAHSAELSGVGTAPCSNMIKVRDTSAELVYLSWVQGFVSGANAMRSSQGQPYKDVAGMPAETMKDFLRTYCGLHPQSTLASAAIAMAGQLPVSQNSR